MGTINGFVSSRANLACFDSFCEWVANFAIFICNPSDRWVKLEKNWKDQSKGKSNKAWTDEDTKQFIAKTMKSLRGETNYFQSYCAHLDPEFKTRKFVPRPKPRYLKSSGQKPLSAEEHHDSLPKTLSLKDTELMRRAGKMYSKDLESPTLRPIDTHHRIMGYCRPNLYHTGLTVYQESIGRLAYELVRDDRIPKYVPSNGGRPKWGYPPEMPRQPLTDGLPFDGERLY